MKSILKLIRRFFLILILSIVLILFLNLILFFLMFYHQSSSRSPWKAAEMVAGSLLQAEDGTYELQDEGKTVLEQSGAWAILVDADGSVKWSSSNLPSEIPLHYTLAELSWAIRGYIEDYPTTVGEYGDDLLIMGHPKTAYWKAMWNTFDYDMIANLPQTVVIFLLFNLVIVFLIYLFAVSGVLRSVKPIIRGIEALPEGPEVYVKEKGLLSSLAVSLNRTAEKLRMQEYDLKKKETARANWIAGVSHDIRTPLSMVMGYASQLEDNKSLAESERKKAGVIRFQSMRIKNLINDLNLSSKLEYNAQPIQRTEQNAVSLLRKVVVDFLNVDPDNKYSLVWTTDESLTSCLIQADANLLQRAVSNLIVNAQVHNPDGCTISAKVCKEGDMCRITISDDGKGVSDEQLATLRTSSGRSPSKLGEQQHGLGLLIVGQIAAAHDGRIEMDHSPVGGFQVSIILPLSEKRPPSESK